MMRSDQPPPAPTEPRLARDLLVVVAGVVCVWFGLGILGMIGCIALAIHLGGEERLSNLDALGIVVVGKTLGDLAAGFFFGKHLRRVNAWYVLPWIAVLNVGLLVYMARDAQLPTVPLPLVPVVVMSLVVMGAGIKLGHHCRRRGELRRADPAGKYPWLQFELRTLMLFVLLCSLVLGSWYALFEPFRRRDRLIATIEQRWGSIEIEDDGPAWLTRLLGKRYTGSVVSIAVSTWQSSVQLSEEEILEILESTDGLRELRLSETPITDDGLARLPDLPKLEDLSLLSMGISGTGLRRLEALPALLGLDLGYSEIEEENLVHLEPLTNLQSLSLIQVQVGDEGLVHLKPLRKLSLLSLSETKITDRGLVHLRGLDQLEVLALSHTAIRGQGLAHISGLNRLRFLNLAGTWIDDDALVHIEDLSALETLRLDQTNIEGEGLVHLAKLQKLKTLSLDDTNVNDRALAHLAELRNLEILSLSRTQITDAGLVHLRTLDRLEFLRLEGTHTTAQRLLELDEAMPDCAIVW